MDTAQLLRIAFRGSPLWCRELGKQDGATITDEELAARRIDRWQDVLGNEDILKSRLRAVSLPFATVRRLLGGGGRRETPVPWAMSLGKVVRSYYHPEAGTKNIVNPSDRAYDPLAPLPFQEVFVGFVRYARSEVKVRAGFALSVLCTPALVQLERQLLRHLTFIGSLAVGYDYYQYRFALAPVSAVERIWATQKRSSKIYRVYIQHMHSRGFVELVDTYPVLARLLCQSVEQWICNVVEFCRRFQDDFGKMRLFFSWEVSKSRRAVKHIEADLSDRHRGGRTVFECELADGAKVIYKPRCVKPEAAFNRFIRWLNDHDLTYQLKSIQVLDRETHGWTEAVANMPCKSLEEVQSFYYRAGMLLGALHILAATDVHRENLIASGDQPIVVDFETILNDAVRVREGLNKGLAQG